MALYGSHLPQATGLVSELVHGVSELFGRSSLHELAREGRGSEGRGGLTWGAQQAYLLSARPSILGAIDPFLLGMLFCRHTGAVGGDKFIFILRASSR